MMNENPNIQFVDEGVPESLDKAIPAWLIAVYSFLPIFGLTLALLFWNGSWGWGDRGAWAELQQAANTTFPMAKFPQSDLSLEARQARETPSP